MNRRFFIGAMAAAVTVVTGLVPLSAFGGDDEAPSMKPYETLDRIEVKVASSKGERLLVFKDGKPQRLRSKGKPIAVSFEEHGEDTVRMNVFAIENDGSYRLMEYTYAGFDSQQILGNYGISMRVSPKVGLKH